MQVNNIQIKRDTDWNDREIFYCIAPDGRVLESFMLKVLAIKWAKETKDFLEN
ncbi:hypothetical protein LCGC14_0579940 [marine sediment metagenome]|uniref:Uncharacterized protein n=1 Tax=marine sediment metagenome TaxID=412755 RepID=A0A0F9S0C6_9ZZZZ